MTQAMILVDTGKEYKGIFTRLDGYPEYTGVFLRDFYNTKQLALKLISLGAINVLRETIKLTEQESYVVYDEMSLEILTAPTYEEFCKQYNMAVSFHYLFKDNKWHSRKYLPGTEFRPIPGISDLYNPYLHYNYNI